MKYIKYSFKVKEPELFREILLAELSDYPFESFEEKEFGLLAYAREKELKIDEIKAFIAQHDYITDSSYTEIEDVNWNQEWEKEYEPIMVENQCLIRAPFHPDDPHFLYQVIIKPQMSFGTGHHDTTYLMVKHLLNENIYNKAVLDMGCGTGVLAIVAELKGAQPVWAIDNDEWAYKNTLSNCLLNGTENISVKFGDSALIPDREFACILANINKNVLLKDIKTYAEHLEPNGVLLLSGFFDVDVEDISKAAVDAGLKVELTDKRNEWAIVKCVK